RAARARRRLRPRVVRGAPLRAARALRGLQQGAVAAADERAAVVLRLLAAERAAHARGHPRGADGGRDPDPRADPRGRAAVDARLRAGSRRRLVLGSNERRACRARGVRGERRARARTARGKPARLRSRRAPVPGRAARARGAPSRAAAAQAAVAVPGARPPRQERQPGAVARDGTCHDARSEAARRADPRRAARRARGDGRARASRRGGHPRRAVRPARGRLAARVAARAAAVGRAARAARPARLGPRPAALALPLRLRLGGLRAGGEAALGVLRAAAPLPRPARREDRAADRLRPPPCPAARPLVGGQLRSAPGRRLRRRAARRAPCLPRLRRGGRSRVGAAPHPGAAARRSYCGSVTSGRKSRANRAAAPPPVRSGSRKAQRQGSRFWLVAGGVAVLVVAGIAVGVSLASRGGGGPKPTLDPLSTLGTLKPVTTSQKTGPEGIPIPAAAALAPPGTPAG